MNIKHDVFFSERSLTDGQDVVGAAIEDLRARGIVYVGHLAPP
jgi:arginyl-tRNA synthetase